MGGHFGIIGIASLTLERTGITLLYGRQRSEEAFTRKPVPLCEGKIWHSRRSDASGPIDIAGRGCRTFTYLLIPCRTGLYLNRENYDEGINSKKVKHHVCQSNSESWKETFRKPFEMRPGCILDRPQRRSSSSKCKSWITRSTKP